MNAARLLALYNRVADAPDAVPRLRRFVLDLAVRGKLVEQDPADEPTSELLKRIAAEKSRLARTGKPGRRKSIVPLDPDEIPFPLAKGWKWTQITQLGVVSPRNEAPDDYEASFVPMPMIAAEYGLNSHHEPRAWGEIKKGYTHFAEGDVGLAKITPCFENGKSTVFRNLKGGIGSGTTELHIVRPLLTNADYIVLFLKSPHFIETGIAKMTGTAGQKRVPLDYFTSSPFPLPPLAEQLRIVAKVDELMALCDQLEETRTARENTRDRLTKASYARLHAPDTDDETFHSYARFTVDTLPALTTRADQIKHLRRFVLDLAVRGKLVEQDPADEPTSELLKRIAAEKSRLARTGKPGRRKSIVPLDPDEIPFPLAKGWKWTQITQLGVVSPRNEAPDDYEASFVPMPMIAAEYGLNSHHEPRAWGEIKKGYTHFAEGDVGLAKITPCFENGKSTVFRNLKGGIGSGTTELHIVRPLLTNADYIVLFLKSPHFIETGIAKMTGTAGQKRVPLDYFTSSPFPLPPLAEQLRIVAKVDELMALCDRLEASLRAADTTRHHLRDSLLQDALESAANELEAAE